MLTALLSKLKQLIGLDSPVPAKKAPDVVRQYTLNFFEPDVNSNKVWIGLAYDDGTFESRFGRVRDGANLASKKKVLGSRRAAENELERKRNEKLRKGYRDTAVVGNENIGTSIATKPKADELLKIASSEIGGASQDSVTSELIKYLADVNIHHITHVANIKYNSANATFSTPLGVLVPEAISRARDLINEIKECNDRASLEDPARSSLVRDYFQLVPKDFGMKIPPAATLLGDSEQIEAEVSLLEALDSMIDDKAAGRKMFNCRLVKMPHYTDEGKATFHEINGLFRRTRNFNHHPSTANLKMVRLYEVHIDEMMDRFVRKSAVIGNVRADLWHGTRASNLLSILKNGLVIPPANAAYCTGRMFGNGIYTSLQSTKALNYATDMWNRSGSSGQRVFMFLCEVALGKVHKPRNFSATFPKRGTDSTWVEPNSSGVLNHECIVYDPAQVNLKYLAEFGEK